MTTDDGLRAAASASAADVGGPRPELPIRTSKRAAILAAAKDLLWERGFEAMSPRDVMERSGAGQGSLYHHFSGKLELAETALLQMVEEETAAIAALFAPERAPLDRVLAYLGREREALRGCRIARLANEAAMQEPALRRPVAAFLAEIAGRLETALGEARAAGTLDPRVEPRATAAMLLAVVEGGFVLARAHWEPARMAAAIDGARQILLLARSSAEPHPPGPHA